MRFSDTHFFDAPIEQVWEMVTNPAAHVAKFESMGHRDVAIVEHTASESDMTLVLSRVVTTELPGFMRKVMKPTNTVISTDYWQRRDDGTCGGHFSVETHGAPIKATGTTELRATSDGTSYEVTVELEVKVPIIGGKISNWARGDVERQIRMEFDAAEAWLASH